MLTVALRMAAPSWGKFAADLIVRLLCLILRKLFWGGGCAWSGRLAVRLDPRVLAWLRGEGRGHLTRINDILTNLMETERRGGAGSQ
jgi:hypothetical protein